MRGAEAILKSRNKLHKIRVRNNLVSYFRPDSLPPPTSAHPFLLKYCFRFENLNILKARKVRALGMVVKK